MPTGLPNQVMQRFLTDLRRDAGGIPDGELLVRFLRSRDEDALAALVQRHGPMVWGVCCRLLRNHHDAEDAFQATFLVLVRKARCVPQQAVAGWLYGVARQTAVRLRATRAKQQRRETRMEIVPEPVTADIRDVNLQVSLDEELNRLPVSYRTVVVLCDLEGMTRKEAARQLGIPEGSVASRLARARELLANRLTRRGIAPQSMSLPAGVALHAAGNVPKSVVETTIKISKLLVVGKVTTTGAISAEVAILTEETIKAMLFTQFKSMFTAVMVLGLLTTGATSLAYFTTAGRDNRDSTKKPPASQTGKYAKKATAKILQEAKDKSLSKDLGKIEPPGGVPLSLVKPGTKEIGVNELNKVRTRMEAVPEQDLEKWVVELERIMDAKLIDGIPSPRQACRTDFAIHMSVAFNDLKWNAEAANKLYKRACTIPKAEAKAWKEAFESVLKKEFGVKQIGKGKFTNLAGGPTWTISLVLIAVDDLYEGRKYSVARGKKYRLRLAQLTAEDVSLWRNKVDRFGGTDLDASVNIILLDDFFKDEKFQQNKFKVAVERQQEKKTP